MGPAGCVVHGNTAELEVDKCGTNQLSVRLRRTQERCLSVTYHLSRACSSCWAHTRQHGTCSDDAGSKQQELGLMPVDMPMRTAGMLIYCGFFSSTSVLRPFASHLCRFSTSSIEGYGTVWQRAVPGACATVRRGGNRCQ
ncbi:hypothetical protein CGRA01v4_01618 [Colletotrichum graminicola]|nr:hypothetical protein CGRA01v4_01618 [Colletotrichum graminicola]